MDAVCVSRPVRQMPSGWCSGQAGKKIPNMITPLLHMQPIGFWRIGKNSEGSGEQIREGTIIKIRK